MKNLDLKDLEILVTTQDFQKQVEGYGLTTANILYRRPDHPWLLQSYVWQNYDLYPHFPELQCFLEFWQKSLEGALHSVTFAHSRLIKPVEIKAVDGVFRLHGSATGLIGDRFHSVGLDRLGPSASSTATLSQFGVKAALGSLRYSDTVHWFIIASSFSCSQK
jgi:uncharacterized protein Usg